mmetsp:Transcript_13783/g.43398  ORF Transcript_13783/g.43398 Transcript_13783/m.43398 type:complete len:271 (-) Transcript_13783:330-1142(-)
MSTKPGNCSTVRPASLPSVFASSAPILGTRQMLSQQTSSAPSPPSLTAAWLQVATLQRRQRVAREKLDQLRYTRSPSRFPLGHHLVERLKRRANRLSTGCLVFLGLLSRCLLPQDCLGVALQAKQGSNSCPRSSLQVSVQLAVVLGLSPDKCSAGRREALGVEVRFVRQNCRVKEQRVGTLFTDHLLQRRAIQEHVAHGILEETHCTASARTVNWHHLNTRVPANAAVDAEGEDGPLPKEDVFAASAVPVSEALHVQGDFGHGFVGKVRD